MTNQEVISTVRDIGIYRTKFKIVIQQHDAWFLFNMSNKVANAETLTDGQKKYLLFIYFVVKNNKYRSKDKHTLLDKF